MNRQQKTFYISGGNGTHLVEDFLTTRGWERINDRQRDDYKLRWCELKNSNSICQFREGEQLLYQIPNNGLLTTKIGLLSSLEEYNRVMWKVNRGNKILKYQEFFPQSFRLDLREGRNKFFDVYQDGELWISKPTGANQGRGIYLIRNQQDIQKIKDRHKEFEEDDKKKNSFKTPMARLVQRYITNPLLLDGRKFDVRNYLIIACTNPLIVFYRDGYCRLTCTKYDTNSTDLTGHLTNQYMQKKSPNYEQVKEDTVWSMDHFNEYINENFYDETSQQIPYDWVNTVLRKRCQQIMLHCFNSVRHRLDCKLGYFDLIGCDFLIHDDFSISLLEMNTNPALHTNCQVLRDCIPHVVNETLGLVLECHEKANKRMKIQPITTKHNCVLLYNADVFEAAERREKIQQITEMQQKLKSARRKKQFNASQYIYRRNQNPPSPIESNEQRKQPMTKTDSMTSQKKPFYAGGESTTNEQRKQPMTRTDSMTSQKKPFYAGGTNESISNIRPFSQQHHHRNIKYRHITARVITRPSQQQKTPTNDDAPKHNDDDDVIENRGGLDILQRHLTSHDRVRVTSSSKDERHQTVMSSSKDERHKTVVSPTKDERHQTVGANRFQQQYSAKNRHQLRIGFPSTTCKIELNHFQQRKIQYQRRRHLDATRMTSSTKADLTSSMLNMTSPMLMLNGNGDVITRKSTFMKFPYSPQTSSMYDVTMQRHRVNNHDDVSKSKRHSGEVIDNVNAAA